MGPMETLSKGIERACSYISIYDAQGAQGKRKNGTLGGAMDVHKGLIP